MKQITVENFNYSNVKEWIDGYTHKQKVEFAVYCAELVIDLYTGTSDAPRKAIQAAKDWILNPSEENKNKCKAAADAADAADAAAYAASASAADTTADAAAASAYAAAAAAYASAYAATGDAAAGDAAKKTIKDKIVNYLLGRTEKPQDKASEKHCHYDMIVAKAANMGLVLFRKTPESKNWEVCVNNWMPTDIQDEYFLCLPQHKEACLHWLNGGDIEEYSEAMGFAELGWHEVGCSDKWSSKHSFMSETEIRIKPKKEKRWIGVTCKGVVDRYFDSELDLCCYVSKNYVDSVSRSLSCHEIEVEV